MTMADHQAMVSVIQGRLSRVSGVTPQLTYAERLVQIYGATEVWRLVDIESGTTVPAQTTSARNGTSSGLTLQDASSPVAADTLKAPKFTATTPSYCDLTSASLISAFNGSKMSKAVWVKMEAGAWSDGAERNFMMHYSNTTNLSMLQKFASVNNLRAFYRANSVTKTVSASIGGSTDWFHFGVSYDTAAGTDGEMKVYVNGAQVGTTQTGLGTWAGALVRLTLGIHGGDLTTLPFSGWLAYAAVRYGAVWTADDFAGMFADANP